MDLGEFQALAGGPLSSAVKYDSWSAADKAANFWSFFLEVADEASCLYGGVSVRELVRAEAMTIEHIVPKSALDAALADAPRPLRYGASVNPFNLAPAHRALNSARSARPFDIDDDPIVRRFRLPTSPAELEAGVDADAEWVLPQRSRGAVARAVLYMSLIYARPFVNAEALAALAEWAREEPAREVERSYGRWIEARLGIRNPLMSAPELILELLPAVPLKPLDD